MVSLFILKDLQPLISQVQSAARSPTGRYGRIWIDGTVINVYDLADPSSCHIFVNQRAMVGSGLLG